MEDKIIDDFKGMKILVIDASGWCVNAAADSDDTDNDDDSNEIDDDDSDFRGDDGDSDDHSADNDDDDVSILLTSTWSCFP